MTKKISVLAAISLACASGAHAQFGRPLDWSSLGGDAQHTGWEKSDSRITKENVGSFELVLKRRLDNSQKGPHWLTPPVVLGNLISYRGFKELAFVAGSSDTVWSLDADLDRMFWQKHLDVRKSSCGLTAVPSLTPGFAFPGGGRGRGQGGGRGPVVPAVPPSPGAAGRGPGRGPAGGGFGAPRPLYVVSSDGKLHRMNTSDGSEPLPVMNFLPANAKASSLTVLDGVVYATTTTGCASKETGVWAIDLSSTEPNATPVATSFPLSGSAVAGLEGLSLGTDGTVYVQTGEGALHALTPKELKLKASFTVAGGSSVTPVVFAYKGKDLVVTAGKDGSLYLLDSTALATPLFQTAATASGTIWGGLSTWEDTDGTRWVIAPVWGTAGNSSKGSIAAYKLEEQTGRLQLTAAWTSREMTSPEPPVITAGTVFALAAGGGSTHATLYALDAITGKEVYSTANQVGAPANLTGLSIANGRVYFTTTDNTLYAFGIRLER